MTASRYSVACINQQSCGGVFVRLIIGTRAVTADRFPERGKFRVIGTIGKKHTLSNYDFRPTTGRLVDTELNIHFAVSRHAWAPCSVKVDFPISVCGEQMNESLFRGGNQLPKK